MCALGFYRCSYMCVELVSGVLFAIGWLSVGRNGKVYVRFVCGLQVTVRLLNYEE